MAKLALTLRRFRLGGWAITIIVFVLLILPLPHLSHVWCKEAPALISQMPDAVCDNLLDRKLVTGALLLAFTQMFTLITLASNWNLIGGFTGYIDFGHAVFFSLGAFGTGILMTSPRWELWPEILTRWPAWQAILAGAFVAATFAILIGPATLHLNGPYFSIAMLGTFVAMREIARIASPLTGGVWA